jgi:hypothetical protein
MSRFRALRKNAGRISLLNLDKAGFAAFARHLNNANCTKIAFGWRRRGGGRFSDPRYYLAQRCQDFSKHHPLSASTSTNLSLSAQALPVSSKSPEPSLHLLLDISSFRMSLLSSEGVAEPERTGGDCVAAAGVAASFAAGGVAAFFASPGVSVELGPATAGACPLDFGAALNWPVGLWWYAEYAQ